MILSDLCDYSPQELLPPQIVPRTSRQRARKMMIPNIVVVYLWLLCKDMVCLSQDEAQVKVILLFVMIF